MSIIHRRGGDILPGFDCQTGEAIHYTVTEWHYRIKGMTTVQSLITASTKVYEGKQLRYEIFALENELR